MADPRFQPVGPIKEGQNVLLCSIINGAPYIATYDTSVKDCIFRFLPRPNSKEAGISPGLTEQNILVLQYEGVIERGVFVDTKRGLQLLPYFSSGTPYLSLQVEASAVALPSMTTSYAKPPSPEVLLSGASYEVQGSSDTKTGIVVGVRYLNPTNGGILTVAARVIPIYLPYIASSGSGGTLTCSAANALAFNAAQVFFCSWALATSNTVQGSYCSAQAVPSTTWTSHDDCSSNFNYTYCPAGTFCGGTTGCYAECANGGDCVVRSGKLVCAGGSPTPPPTPGGGGGTQPLRPIVPRRIEPLKIAAPWYDSWWFIIALIAFVLSILFVIYMYVKYSDTAIVANQEYINSMQYTT